MSTKDLPYLEEEKLVIVPKFQHLCRVCSWAVHEIDIYNWASKKALQGIPSGTVHRQLEEYLKEIGRDDIKVPSRKSFWNHFDKHIPPQNEVEILAAKQAYSPKPYDPLVDAREIKAIEAGNFDEYKELCKLYSKFRQVHDKIYELSGSLLGGNNGHGTATTDWSQNKIQTFVSMVNTQKSILAEIGKMRQGDKLVNVAAKFVVETFTKNIVTKLTEEFSALAAIMKRQGVADEILDTFENVTHDRLARLLVDMAQEAMTATKKEFKLTN
jgi:hypothetical protein